MLAGGTGRRRWLFIAAIGVGFISGSLAMGRSQTTLAAELPRGRGVLTGVALTDAVPYGSGVRFVVRPTGWSRRGELPTHWQGPPLSVTIQGEQVVAGDKVAVEGRVIAQPDTIRGDPVAGRVAASAVSVLDGSTSPLIEAGNAVRRRVQTRLARLGVSPESGLLAGFLIGDTSQLPRADTEALRRAGLTHYVAVSGSNVALVLGAWWLVLGPTGASSRVRAMTGLIVLLVFVVATRWESSVIRAATMATLMMGGKAVGVVLDAWAALGGAVVLLLVVSGDLAIDIGFQLSVFATGGVLAGATLWRKRSPRWLWALLAATLGAQAAVVPLLLWHFDTVPLLSPLANVIAAPLVTASTAAAGLGVLLGWDFPLHIAEPIAGLVLGVARTAAGWPQLGVVGTATIGGLLALAWPTPLRLPVLAAVTVVSMATVLPPGPPSVPTVVFLDVGQGDAVLLRDPSGAVALIDGGRSPTVLADALRRYGVRRIDLLVATHGDADHVGGFVGLVSRIPVGHFWVPEHAELGEVLAGVVDAAAIDDVAVQKVGSGFAAALGEFRLEVVGPGRRYAADNDGSIVLLVAVGDTTVLLPGDVGAVAQAELPSLQPDVLMVPHHGAATTDPGWLEETAGSVAIISVGENSYGHPDHAIVSVLREAGAEVFSTINQGDIAVPLR